MARKAKEPARLEGWYRLKESGGKGTMRREWDVTVDIQYGKTFADLRDEMERIERTYGEDFEKFKFETEREQYRYEEGDYIVTYVYGWRKETDEEYAERLNQAAKMEADREARERAEFERLARKFADKA